MLSTLSQQMNDFNLGAPVASYRVFPVSLGRAAPSDNLVPQSHQVIQFNSYSRDNQPPYVSGGGAPWSRFFDNQRHPGQLKFNSQQQPIFQGQREIPVVNFARREESVGHFAQQHQPFLQPQYPLPAYPNQPSLPSQNQGYEVRFPSYLHHVYQPQMPFPSQPQWGPLYQEQPVERLQPQQQFNPGCGCLFYPQVQQQSMKCPQMQQQPMEYSQMQQQTVEHFQVQQQLMECPQMQQQSMEYPQMQQQALEHLQVQQQSSSYNYAPVQQQHTLDFGNFNGATQQFYNSPPECQSGEMVPACPTQLYPVYTSSGFLMPQPLWSQVPQG